MLQANFPIGSRSITVYGLTQYDYGQVLEIYGLPLPAVVECQISLQNVGGTTESLAGVMVDNVLRLNIPDTYLAQDVTIDYAIYLFVYVTTEDSGTTVYKVILPVTSRPEPDGYVPGETSPFAAVIDEITDLVEEAQEAATASESWAVGGTGTRAGENTDNASYYATQAGESAVAAASSEGNAAASETAAASSERNAASSESNAASSERNAAVSEINAAASERNAADYAGAASISAHAAGLSETAAEGHANSASSSALKAEGYAVGKQNGSDVPSGSTYYHNNAEYYADQAATQLTLVTNAKDDALGDISTAKTNAVGDVNNAKTIAVGAVQDKGTEVLNSIPADYTTLSNDVSSLKSDLNALTDLGALTFNDGIFNAVSQTFQDYSGYKYTKIPVSIYCGGYMKGTTGIAPNNQAIGLSFVDEYDVVLATHYSTNTGSYKYEYNVQVPSGSIYVYINLRTASESLWVNPEFNLDVVFDNLQEIGEIKTALVETNNKVDNVFNPILRNGSIGNSANSNAVATKYILPIATKYDFVEFEYIGDISSINKYAFNYTLFKNATDGMLTSVAFSDASITKKNWNDSQTYKTNLPYIRIPIGDINQYDHIAVSLFVFDDNGGYIPLRATTSQYCFKISYGYNQEKDITTKLNNARHIKGNSSAPITILHFSDIHADVDAMNRILSDARNNKASIDQMICTGDIVNNSAGQISSWWNENVLTCIGNHDSASYSGGAYDWTALSMVDRDTYYIAPFESNWGITHTSGTSYYYKDYATQKVRLIVMDGMLYIGNTTTSEASTQTSWLENLLADAITNNLHVLIAIHAPHGGATAEECSFSKYGQGTMPTNTDCNTPQAVIDAVATKITEGLKFIGYLCGHTHQDNIWDAEGDNKQLMYCVTCAAVSNANQWKNSDQNRSTFEDAYNLVTIDTANTLVKIIRGGGADIDDHMRTRKAICFNYSTGEKVGEVL